MNHWLIGRNNIKQASFGESKLSYTNIIYFRFIQAFYQKPEPSTHQSHTYEILKKKIGEIKYLPSQKDIM